MRRACAAQIARSNRTETQEDYQFGNGPYKLRILRRRWTLSTGDPAFSCFDEPVKSRLEISRFYAMDGCEAKYSQPDGSNVSNCNLNPPV